MVTSAAVLEKRGGSAVALGGEAEHMGASGEGAGLEHGSVPGVEGGAQGATPALPEQPVRPSDNKSATRAESCTFMTVTVSCARERLLRSFVTPA